MSAEICLAGITKCVARGGDMVTCKFSVNVNKTQTAFGVYFYPDTGSEGY